MKLARVNRQGGGCAICPPNLLYSSELRFLSGITSEIRSTSCLLPPVETWWIFKKHSELSAVRFWAVAYLFTPVVCVVSGVCVAPDFGMTVSFIFVRAMLGSFSARFSAFNALQSSA